jgi:hypothetical protein
MPRRITLAKISDDKLLDLRIKDLPLRIAGTWLERCVKELYRELDEHGILLHPHVWLSSEWFSPVDIPGIAIPFYLAHPRLIRLERKRILEVEGGTRSECLRILRHEAGHAVQRAFQLHRRRDWQRMFGSASKRYPAYYKPNPASRRYVQHLRLWYAQSHPDEDFAETFAVWLRPRSNWRKRYAGWPALKKLEFVDALMKEIAGKTPKNRRRGVEEPLGSIKEKLRDYYDSKESSYSFEIPKVYDRDLRRLFSDNPRHRKALSASAFLRRNRARIRPIVSRWTGEYQLTIDAVFDDMIARCRELKLKAVGSQRQLRVNFTVLLTAKTVHSLYGSSRKKFAL